jgi:hypothetical protein
MLHLTRAPRRALMLVAVACGVAASTGSAQAASELPTGVPLEFVFEHSGKVANVAEANPNVGAKLIQWGDGNGGFVNDQFKLAKAPASSFGPNRYYINPMHATNRYVGMSCSFGVLGCQVQLKAPSLGREIVWHAEPTGDNRLHLVNDLNNQAMNVAEASPLDGASIITWPRQMFPASPYHNDHILVRAGN